MPVALINSAFHFKYKGHEFRVVFSDAIRKWTIYNGDTKLTEWPWNGIKVLPTAQDAEDVLKEYLGIEE